MLNDATPGFLDRLAATLPPGTLRPVAPRDVEEPRGRHAGRAAAVARPADAAQVAAILRACAAARVGVIPLGGGTGLVGGQVAGDGPLPLLLSLERMTAVRGVWPQENVLAVEAGATLAAAQQAAAGVERLFPLSIASEGTARIGGILGTNAGGVNVLRYGNARDLCLGLEAVFADGSIWNGLRRLRKDNTGYDLRNLLIGSEGTLAVITAASLRLAPIPPVRGTAYLAVASPEAALRLLSLSEARLPGLVSAFELMGRAGFDFLAEAGFALRLPFDPMPEWSVLLDLGLPAGMVAEEEIAALFEAGLAQGLVSDAVIAQNEGQRQAFWALRETIPLANRRIGAVASHDISVPLGLLPEFLARAGAAIAAIAPVRINVFGHLGDGNLHYNVFPRAGEARAVHDDRRGAITGAVHDLVRQMGGSISAEHGIGRAKVADLERHADPAKLAAMRAIKAALDPLGILNPGAVLRAGQAVLHPAPMPLPLARRMQGDDR